MEEIYAVGGELHLAITLDDEYATNKSGRVYLDDFTSTQEIPLVKCRSINDPEVVDAIRRADLDWLFVIGWSQIAGPEVLQSTRHGVVGMHPTLLPIGRGRASVPWAILKDLDHTGVSMFVLDVGVDTGPILAQERVSISSTETATTLYEKIAQAHVTLLRQNWGLLARGEIVPKSQDETGATYWPGRKPEDGQFRPGELKIDELDRMVRALTRPYPGAFTRLKDGRKLVVWAGTAECQGTTHELHLNCADGVYCPTDYSLSLPNGRHVDESDVTS